MDMLTFSKDREPELIAADLNETVGDVVELMQTRGQPKPSVQLAWQPRRPAAVSLRPRSAAPGDPERRHQRHRRLRKAGRAPRSTSRIECDRRRPLRPHSSSPTTAKASPPEDLKRIFSVFESSKGSRGTGLGLPVSQKIIREHGGDIRVESTLGVGSKFVLELPALAAEDSKVGKTMAS